ncbi:MAG: DUF2927 domain-containing protein [Rhodobacteraceae bacterium]|nr:DUF2927 domain-containing protein [Paracoccaceae bacterium]
MQIGLAALCLANCAEQQRQSTVYDSEAASLGYERLAETLKQHGQLKTHVEPGRQQVSATQLARNFEKIAFFSEYSLEDGEYVAHRGTLRLQRWETPLRATIVFGESVSPEKQANFRGSVAGYLQRLEAITGHSMQLTTQDPNFLILVLSTEELDQANRLIRRFSRQIPRHIGRSIASSHPSVLCSAYTIASSETTPSLFAGVAFIRSEHRGIMMQACIHEELAQALGMPNDNLGVFPSIFNDNEEYALLTDHDEQLLQILYDPRLQVGMTRTEARSIVTLIAEELTAAP